MAAAKRVNTATLIRGAVYTLRHPDSTPKEPKDSLRFENGVPQIIAEKHILEALEDLVDETEDNDGEIFEKPRFKIERNVAAPEDKSPRRTRLDASRPVKKRPRKRRN